MSLRLELRSVGGTSRFPLGLVNRSLESVTPVVHDGLGIMRNALKHPHHTDRPRRLHSEVCEAVVYAPFRADPVEDRDTLSVGIVHCRFDTPMGSAHHDRMSELQPGESRRSPIN